MVLVVSLLLLHSHLAALGMGFIFNSNLLLSWLPGLAITVWSLEILSLLLGWWTLFSCWLVLSRLLHAFDILFSFVTLDLFVFWLLSFSSWLRKLLGLCFLSCLLLFLGLIRRGTFEGLCWLFVVQCTIPDGGQMPSIWFLFWLPAMIEINYLFKLLTRRSTLRILDQVGYLGPGVSNPVHESPMSCRVYLQPAPNSPALRFLR